jgi:hypothetical protein
LNVEGVVLVSAGHLHSMIIKNDTKAYGFGFNLVIFCFFNFQDGQLGDNVTIGHYRTSILPVDGPSNVTKLALGLGHSTLISNGSVYTCGKNNVNYQLF